MDKLYCDHFMAATFNSWWRFGEFIRVLGAAAAYLHVSLAFFSTFMPVAKEFKAFAKTTYAAKGIHLMRLFLSIGIKGLNFLKIWANGDEYDGEWRNNLMEATHCRRQQAIARMVTSMLNMT